MLSLLNLGIPAAHISLTVSQACKQKSEAFWTDDVEDMHNFFLIQWSVTIWILQHLKYCGKCGHCGSEKEGVWMFWESQHQNAFRRYKLCLFQDFCNPKAYTFCFASLFWKRGFSALEKNAGPAQEINFSLCRFLNMMFSTSERGTLSLYGKRCGVTPTPTFWY